MNELTIRIRGGERVRIRPMTIDDAAAVHTAIGHLSLDSRRFRFFSAGGQVPRAVVDDLVTMADDRIVLVAISADGEVLGEARALRRDDDSSIAEIAVTVADDHQRRRLGTKLLRELGRQARRAGIERLSGFVQVDNAAAQRMLVLARAVCWHAEPGVIGFEIPLGRRTISPDVVTRRTLHLAS